MHDQNPRLNQIINLCQSGLSQIFKGNLADANVGADLSHEFEFIPPGQTACLRRSRTIEPASADKLPYSMFGSSHV